MAKGATGGMTVNVKAFSTDLNRVAKRHNISSDDIVKGFHGAWGIDILRRSPPYPKGFAGSGKPPSQAAAKKQGKIRVEKDIRKVIVDIDSSQNRAAKMSGHEFRRFRNKRGAVYGVDKQFFEPAASSGRIARFHQKQRSKSTGRVTTAGTLTRDIGRWKFVDKLHVRGTALRRYIRERQRHVGRLKAGWIPASDKYGVGHLVPSWVRKAGLPRGRAISRSIKRDGTGFYISINSVPYGSRKLERIIRFTRGVRERELANNLDRLAGRTAKMLSARKGRVA